MDMIAQRVLAVGLVGITLTLARRWKNCDKSAGLGVAGWTIFIIFCLVDQ